MCGHDVREHHEATTGALPKTDDQGFRCLFFSFPLLKEEQLLYFRQGEDYMGGGKQEKNKAKA